MNSKLILILMTLLVQSIYVRMPKNYFQSFLKSETLKSVPQTDPVETDAFLDFWIGKWEASWDEGEGIKPYGTNRISKIMDGTVILEEFKIESGKSAGFMGMSMSTIQSKKQSWRQAWTDNQGGYFSFTGIAGEGEKIFQTEINEQQGRKVVQRMVFKEIQENEFIWDWEASQDGGTSWKLNWRIHYKRLK